MSQLVAAPLLLNTLKQKAINAWELSNAAVEYGIQRIANTIKPRCLIDLQPVAMTPSGAKGVEQAHTFRIVGTFAFPAPNVNIQLEQINRANELIAEIMTEPSFLYDTGKRAHQPMIDEVAFFEDDDPQRKCYEVAVTFSCKVREEHYPGAFSG